MKIQGYMHFAHNEHELRDPKDLMPRYMIYTLNGNSSGHDDKQDTMGAYVKSYLLDDEDTY